MNTTSESNILDNSEIIEFVSESDCRLTNAQKKFEDFFESIGSPRLIVAPMVEQSDLSFRMLTRKYGAQLVYTQMLNANSFVNSKDYRDLNFRTCAADRPLIVQFGGHDPTVLLQAAKYVEDHCDAIDINLGCPQGIARRGRYGAFLMDELQLLHDIVSTLSRNIKVPITCKTRIYRDFHRCIQLYDTLIDAGAKLLTIHGRTINEKGTNIAHADWDMLKRIRLHYAHTHPHIPIIANGGIESYDDIERCLAVTGADGVMVSEAILENPSFFSNPHQLNYRARTPLQLAEEYLNFCRLYPVGNFKIIRAHLFKMLHRYFTVHFELRDCATNAKIIEEFEVICQRIRQFIRQNPNGELAYNDSWYRRYRNGDPCRELPDHDGCYTSQSKINNITTKLWNNIDNDSSMFGALDMFMDE